MSTASPKQPPADERATHFKEHNFDNPIYGAGNLEPTLGKCDTLKGEITIPASGALVTIVFLCCVYLGHSVNIMIVYMYTMAVSGVDKLTAILIHVDYP